MGGYERATLVQNEYISSSWPEALLWTPLSVQKKGNCGSYKIVRIAFSEDLQKRFNEDTRG